jgi:hypothetical protein
MSVYNRKMFKPRNARNALNMSAGIAPVQKFHAGGPVGHTHGIQTRQVPISGFGANTSLSQPVRNSSVTNAQAINAARSASPLLNARMNVLQGRGTAPLRQTMNSGSATINLDPSSLSGIGSVLSRSPQPEQSFREFYGGGLKSMVTNPNPMTVGQQTRSDLAGIAATPVDAVVGGVASGMDAVGDLLSPLTSDELTPGFVAAVVSGKQSLPDSVKQQINNREISVPKALSDALLSGKVDPTGVDLAKLSGFQTSQEVADVVEIMNAAPGSQTIAVEKPVPVGPDGQYDGDDLGNAPTTEPDYGDEFGNIAPDGTMPETTTESTNDTATESTNDTATGGAGDGTGTGDAAPTAKEEIDRVINSGTPEEQQSTLDGFIKEFMDKAPGYEGADSGLVLAKIGFAMAAGKSPRAIENIATAMSDGADMLIKDKAKKDEFNRQLKLSALQYGLTEDSKLRTQQRADERNFRNLIATSAGSYTNAAGEKVDFQEGQTLSIPMTDIMANDGQLPAELRNQSFHLEMVKAAADKQKGIDAILAAQRKEQVLSDESQRKESEIYGQATDRYIAGEIGTKYIESALVNLTVNGDDVLGLQGGAKDLGQKLANALGLKAPKNYANKQAFEKDVKKGFQLLIKSYFGGSQSANSISNFDVTSLSDAVVDSAITQKGGSFNLSSLNEDILQDQLQGLLQQFRRDQQSALSTMAGVETRLSTRALPGQVVGSAGSLIQPNQARLQQYISGSALPGGQAARYARQEPKDGDGGMPRFALGAS